MLVHNEVLEKTVLHPCPSVPATASQLHVAIICDGNGRWATARALPRSAGHRAGAEAARGVIRSAPQSTAAVSKIYSDREPRNSSRDTSCTVRARSLFTLQATGSIFSPSIAVSANLFCGRKT